MTVYINMKDSNGTETVDEFTQEAGQTYREFRQYVSEMVAEYHIAGMDVYRSTRACRGW